MKVLISHIALAALLLIVSGFVTASQRMEEGKAIYDENCGSCHEAGVDGAPITGRAEDWEHRSGLWEAVLFEHANKGYLKMPAKGGDNSLTENEVDLAADYMLTITHPDLPRD